MPRWTFRPSEVAWQRTLGEERPIPRRLPRQRTLNGLDLNDYELALAGIHVLNDVTLPQAQGSRQQGTFERRTLHVITESGFQPIRVVTYDAGRRSRELVRTPETTGAVIAAAGAAEVAQSAAELGQVFSGGFTEDQNPPDVLAFVPDPTNDQFPQLGGVAQDPTTGQTTSTGGSVNSTPVTPGGGGSDSSGGTVLPPPPPPPPPPPDTYDPNAYGTYGGGVNDPGGEGL